MRIRDAREPVLGCPLALYLLAVGSPAIAALSIGVGTSIAGVVQRAHRCGGGQWPEDRRLVVAQARWKAQALVAEHLHRLTCGAHARECLEEVSDRLPDLGVGVEDHVAGRVVHEAGGQWTPILAAAHLVEDSAAQPGLQDMQLGFAHGSFQTKHKAIVKVRRVVHPILVEDQRVGERANLQQAVPVGIVSGQAGDFETHHDAGAAHANIADQTLKALAPSR